MHIYSLRIANAGHLKDFYKESYTMEVCIGEAGPNTIPYLSSENIVRKQ